MPYWEYEYRLMEINSTVEKENREQEDQSESVNASKYMRDANRMASSFKMPSVPSIPKI